jgi:hypothetical protein
MKAYRERYNRTLGILSNDMSSKLVPVLMDLQHKQQNLREARALVYDDKNAAYDIVEQKRIALEESQEEGVFKGQFAIT